MSYKSLITLFLLGLGVLFLAFKLLVFSKEKDDRARAFLDKKYPLINDVRPFELKGTLLKKESNGLVRGVRLFSFTNNLYLMIGDDSSNFDYKPIGLASFLQPGDSIYTEERNDSIFIYRDGTEYYFIIGRVTNEK